MTDKQATGTVAQRQLWFLDALATFHVAHGDSQDGISLFEAAAPYGMSPPLHVHHTEDEAFYVLEGELRIQAGEAEFRLRPGQAALGPVGVPHTYRVESRQGARWLNITTRGHFESFARALSRPAERDELPPPQGKLTPRQLQLLAAAGRPYGIDLVGPPLEA
jgi:mannose-6-phosphate isomerase-like protein (cupin superfamily)